MSNVPIESPPQLFSFVVCTRRLDIGLMISKISSMITFLNAQKIGAVCVQHTCRVGPESKRFTLDLNGPCAYLVGSKFR